MGDSQASFSRTAVSAIRQTYGYRCIICLTDTTTSQCAHIIDAASAGERHVRNSVRLGILPEDYKRNSPTNGMVQCASCQAYFTQNFIVLSLPIPILQYLQNYVTNTPKARQEPLHKVLDLLSDARSRLRVELPNPKPIFPYLGLFTMVTLDPTRLAKGKIPTLYLPNLSIIRGSKFVTAPSNTSATAMRAARIFDPLSVDDDSMNPGYIPLSPNVLGFEEKRFWRLPVPAGAILSTLFERLQYDLSDCEDIRLASIIRDTLNLQSHDAYPEAHIGSGDGPGGSGPSGGSGNDCRRGGDGPSRGGGAPSKRKTEGGKGDRSSGKGPKKARAATGGNQAVAPGPFGDTKGFTLQTQSRCGQPGNLRVTSTSNLDYNASTQSTDSPWSDSNSEDGLNVSAISPHDNDNPDEWRFGPSFTTDKIVFTARAVFLN